MPSLPRWKLIKKNRSAVYHCWNRCVRRARLCGRDPLTGQDYSHRRLWIHRREQQLAALFAIEIEFHAELANHLHVVLRTRPDIARRWSRQEVARRWLTITRLAKAPTEALPEVDPRLVAALARDKKQIARLRRRLSKISWLMGTLSENVARRANREDECTGCFWEGRFQCRRLESEAAVLTCGIYVDLNQIRAGEAATPETSRHTSAWERIQARRQRGHHKADGWLGALTLREGPREEQKYKYESRTGRRASDQGLLPLELDDYLQLLDWTGRQLRRGKRGAIPATLAPILDRLAVREEAWLEVVEGLDDWFCHVLGSARELARAAAELGRRHLQGQPASRRLFRSD